MKYLKSILVFLGVSLILMLCIVGCSSDKGELYENLSKQIKVINNKISKESAAPDAFFEGITLDNDSLIYKMSMAPQENTGGVDLVKTYKENPDIIRARFKNAMALSFATHEEINDLMPVVLDSLNLVYKAEFGLIDGSKLKVEFSTPEMRDLIKDGYNKKQYLREILKSDLYFTNQTLPAVFDDNGNEVDSKYYSKDYLKKNYDIMETVFLDDGNVVYIMSLAEKDLTAEEMAKLYSDQEVQEEFLTSQINSDPFYKDVIERCAIAGVGIEHRLVGTRTNKATNVVFPNSLIRRLSRLPYNFLED